MARLCLKKPAAGRNNDDDDDIPNALTLQRSFDGDRDNSRKAQLEPPQEPGKNNEVLTPKQQEREGDTYYPALTPDAVSKYDSTRGPRQPSGIYPTIHAIGHLSKEHLAISPTKPQNHEDGLRYPDIPKELITRNCLEENDDDDDESEESEESDQDDLSDFIVSDSASEAELYIGKRSKRLVPWRAYKTNGVESISSTPEESRMGRQPQSRCLAADPIVDPGFHEEHLSIEGLDTSRGPADDMLQDPQAILRLSPLPRSPCKAATDTPEFATPPTSPSKVRLHSPSKRAVRIPPSPHRPSLGAFWSAEVINDWNDKHSPRKSPNPRRFILPEDSGELSASEAAKKKPKKTPAKRDKKSQEQKKLFASKKHDLATSFLKELDTVIAKGELARLSKSTGGVQIVWNKKLNTTAGRANWRREVIRTNRPKDVVTDTEVRHHLSIEFAEKVIDDEDRLLNVLAHEFCHLANFVISNVKDSPHGKSFKSWAAKVSAAFAHRGIEVTTRHSYQIAYKFIWECMTCGVQFKRHSKSIDASRQTCGACRGRLLQIQPAPRKPERMKVAAKDGATNDQVVERKNPYQTFVKTHYAAVKGENPSWGMSQVMSELSKMYRRQKEAQANAQQGAAVTARIWTDGESADRPLREISAIAADVVVVLDSEDEGDVFEDAVEQHRLPRKDDRIADVAQKLNALDI